MTSLGIGAAAAGLGQVLGIRWLVIAGGIVAVVGAVIRTVIALRRSQLEEAQEQVELELRFRVPIRLVGEIDPTEIGIDPAAQTILRGDKIPEYVPRRADDAIRSAVDAALDGRGPWLVVVEGPSKVGKSRTLFEALRSCARQRKIELVAPIDAAALKSFLTTRETRSLGAGHLVVWLDDIEPFLNAGVTWQTLNAWRSRASSPAIAVATYGGKGSELIGESGSGALATIAGEVLQQAAEISLAATTASELDPLRTALSLDVFQSIEQHGLAAYLVAAPALERKLATGRHAPGEAHSPEGLAVIYAAVDWARCGRTDPLPENLLRELWVKYLPSGVPATDETFENGLAWALRPVAGMIALLHSVASYRAYDYIVRLISERADARTPHDFAWQLAIESATDAQAVAVGTNAYAHGRYGDAMSAWARAITSSAEEVAALALFNTGVTLGELGRSEEAVGVYDEVVERFGEAPELALREQVAMALVNKGVRLGQLGRSEEAVGVYDEVVERFGEAPEPALREAVARALAARERLLRAGAE